MDVNFIAFSMGDVISVIGFKPHFISFIIDAIFLVLISNYVSAILISYVIFLRQVSF